MRRIRIARTVHPRGDSLIGLELPGVTRRDCLAPDFVSDRANMSVGRKIWFGSGLCVVVLDKILHLRSRIVRKGIDRQCRRIEPFRQHANLHRLCDHRPEGGPRQ
jgi:hypothetical protein